MSAHLYYLDPSGEQHLLSDIQLGSKSGFEGSSGELETVSNADSSAVLFSRMNREPLTVSLTIPVHASTPAELEEKENTILSWFRQSTEPGKLVYDRYDNTKRAIEVYVAPGYPVRTYESNTMCRIEVQFIACTPYWSALSPDSVADKATYKNNGDFPATVVYTATANTIYLDSTVIAKAASGQSIIALTIRVTDSSVSVTDSSGANCLYKCSTSSTFALVPVGYATILGATAKVTRRWGNA